MITLYKYSHTSRAETIVWALQELGLDHEIKEIDAKKGEQRSPEFRVAYYLTVVINMAGLLFILAGGGSAFLEGLL